MNIILLFIIAVSLSMDAFSLSIAYGTLNLNKKEITTLSIIVGLYHFIMPIIGMYLGKFILNIINIDEDIIVLIIFSIIGMNMIIESFRSRESIRHMRLFEMITFGFAVSIDSFSIGIGINNITNNFFAAALVFSFTSFIFTYIGLIFGKKLNRYFGKYAIIIGGFTLILLGILYSL